MVIKRRRSGRRYLCRPCAAQRTEAAANQLAEKQGPVYSKWVAAMVAVAEREAGQAS